jgi:N-hydroxyarylamine O-acetyltransferase
MVDLDRYFARIGYTGSRAPTLETLAGISHAHVTSVPFENLDILLGRGIDLDPAAVEHKLVTLRRGGYCFEQNSLLLAVLTQLGFDAHPVGGRVRVGRDRSYTPPRTHLFVRVELDEPWLADVGVGSSSLTAPIRFVYDEPQDTPHDRRRLVRERGLVYHQILYGETWTDVYETNLEAMPPIDREVGNWYTSTHPQSGFKARLTAARATPDGGRVTLLNRELTFRARDGRAESRVMASPDELLDALATHFGLVFPAGTRFQCAALDWPS